MLCLFQTEINKAAEVKREMWGTQNTPQLLGRNCSPSHRPGLLSIPLHFLKRNVVTYTESQQVTDTSAQQRICSSDTPPASRLHIALDWKSNKVPVFSHASQMIRIPVAFLVYSFEMLQQCPTQPVLLTLSSLGENCARLASRVKYSKAAWRSTKILIHLGS